ncbi:UDP-2,3-diacylglucosamine diphosphatase [Agaribacterium sp. ZY112]|uniref:UDP-2,3-diacylglucosamine diphosphatase n=1 Tax=Agaribacterium sp. ZY112 TaxID=3233574 RepID=UPI0035245A4C
MNSKDRPQAPHYRSVFISDVHLGTKDSKASELNDFLKSHRFDQLYLVGDIFDGWRMRSGIHWHKSFNRIISRVLKISKNDIPVYYITGNHDEFLRKFANSHFENIQLLNRKDHICADGRRLLVIHGDQFEGLTHCGRFLKFIGDRGYDFLMLINRSVNHLRARFGFGFWSFSAYLKTHLKRAQRYIHDYEHAVAHGAAKQNYDGVICGHIHQAAIKKVENTDYYNTGDWVESCTAIVEHHDGKMELIHWLEHPLRLSMAQAKKQKIKLKKKKTKALVETMP